MQYKEFFWYLFENYSKTWKAYWLDPRGKFYEVYLSGRHGGSDGHFDFAKKYCEEQGLPINTQEGPVGTLISKGWSRIAFNYYGDYVMHVDTQPSNLTPTILKALKRKADNLEATKVKDTNRERDLELTEDTGNLTELNYSTESFWLDPHGNMHFVSSATSGDGHWGFARKYCIQHNLLPSATGPTDELFKRKWVRVAYNYYNNHVMHFDYKGSYPAPHMLRALQKKAQELGATKIYDDIENDYVEL